MHSIASLMTGDREKSVDIVRRRKSIECVIEKSADFCADDFCRPTKNIVRTYDKTDD